MTRLLTAGADLFDVRSAQAAFREASILNDIDVVQDVVLLRAGPGNLGQRHYYTEQALRDAVARQIFEGAQSYLNHPTTIEEQTQPERSVDKLAGWFSNVTVRDYTDPEVGKTVALFANFHPRVGDDRVISLVRTCVEYAKRYPRKAWAGLSIYARGESVPDTIDGEQWNRVDRIDEVDSVDIVTRAGAGGTLVALKESRMKVKTAANKSKNGKRVTESDGIRFVLDGDAIKEGILKLAESGKTATKASLKKFFEGAGVTLSPEQDSELDRHLGIVDGGALDKVLDDATGVDDSETEDMTPEEGAVSPGSDWSDIEAMPNDPAFLKQQLKKERGAREKAESDREDAMERAEESDRKAGLAGRTRMAESVIASLNIPEDFRPRVQQELIERGYTHEKAMREHVQAFDKAFIRHTDSAGVVQTGDRRGGVSADDFSFDGENNRWER